MGGGCFSVSDWDAYRSRNVRSDSATTGGVGSVYSATRMKSEYDPKNIDYRESRDSDEHPKSTPIIVACDVTGSMNPVLRSVIDNLGTLNEELLRREPVTDPQVAFMAIGDVDYDTAPLQVTQFESDIRQADALRGLWLEHGGGSNSHESYILPWYFAVEKIKADAIEKRGKKGFLFTMGDECCPKKLTKEQILKVFGAQSQDDYTKEELLTAVSRDWEVFHLIIEEGNFYSNRYHIDDTRKQRCENSWEFMGQNVIHVSDHSKLAEIIVSTMQVVAGEDKDSVAGSWDGSTAMVVQHALQNLTNVNTSTGVVEF